MLIALAAAAIAVGLVRTRGTNLELGSVTAVEPSTVQVQLTNLADFEELIGTLEFADSLHVIAVRGGTLIELAPEGSVLERGAGIYVMAREPTDMDLALARQQIATAEAQLATSEAQSETVLGGASAAEVSAAEAAVTQAEAVLSSVLAPASAADIAAADAQVRQAQDALDKLVAGPSDTDLAVAEATVNRAASAVGLAKDNLDVNWDALVAAQSRYCGDDLSTVDVCGTSDLPLTDEDIESLVAEADGLGSTPAELLLRSFAEQLLEANSSYETATALLATAEATLASAQDQLSLLLEGPSDADVEQAQAAVSQATEHAARLKQGPSQTDIAQAEANLLAAEATLAVLTAGVSGADLQQANKAKESAEAALEVALLQQAELVAGPQATVLFYGTVPAWRAMSIDSTPGDDIAQLEMNLVALGFDPDRRITIDGFFDTDTSNAVRAWKRSLGVEATDVVGFGSVVFAPGPSQVGTSLGVATVGSPVGAGTLVAEIVPMQTVSTSISADGQPLDDTVTTQRVIALLPTDRRGLLDVGTLVAVKLPDGSKVAGEVARISTSPERLDGPVDVASFVEVVVTLADPVDELWMGAEVAVEVTAQLVEEVLAVPVSALLALVEGGYALEVVDSDGATTLVGVETGMFADGLVEVAGSGLAAGTTVVVPP